AHTHLHSASLPDPSRRMSFSMHWSNPPPTRMKPTTPSKILSNALLIVRSAAWGELLARAAVQAWAPAPVERIHGASQAIHAPIHGPSLAACARELATSAR